MSIMTKARAAMKLSHNHIIYSIFIIFISFVISPLHLLPHYHSGWFYLPPLPGDSTFLRFHLYLLCVGTVTQFLKLWKQCIVGGDLMLYCCMSETKSPIS